MTNWTVDSLREFEKDIGDRFNNREIRAPIHLYDGNEEHIIKVFKQVDLENDWVCATWRNHYQCLLKGVPADELTDKILAGKSMVMNLPRYRIVCSSIVGGIPSIATGLAYASRGEHVWCWLGDMSAETGAFHEAYKFSVNHKLPITFVIEDNEKSVETPTGLVWSRERPYYLQNAEFDAETGWYKAPNLIYYTYQNTKYPHAGAGVRVQF